MTVLDYLNYLVQVDLKNMNLMDEESYVIRDDKFPLLLMLLKAGIKELNTRFHLSEEVTDVIELLEGTHTINITEGDEPWRSDIMSLDEVYLMGVEPKNLGIQYLPQPQLIYPEPRLKGLMAIDRADDGFEKPCYFMDNNHRLRLYSPYPFAVYQLVCRTAQGAVSTLNLDDELPLPMMYHNALGLYIASRLFKSMDNQLDGDVNESTRYYQAYIQEVQLLENRGYELDRQPQKDLFHQRGFI